MVGNNDKALPGRPNPRLSYKAAVLEAWEEQREREKQMSEAVRVDSEELKAVFLGKEVNLWEIV